MTQDKEGATAPPWLEQIFGGTGLATRVLQVVLALAGAVGLLFSQATEHPAALVASLAVIAAAGVWAGIGALLSRRKPKPPELPAARTASSYFRGLLPFERTDHLLGREQEAGLLLALVRSLEFRFGFLSGEAGAGKTSLIRSILLPRLETDGWHVVYIPRTGPDPAAAIRKHLLISVHPTSPPSDVVTTIALLRWASDALGGKTIILVIDQFEELFIGERTPDSRRKVEADCAS